MPDENKIDLNDESVKAAITEAAEAKAKEMAQVLADEMVQKVVDEKTEGLVNKNNELLGEKKTVKQKLDDSLTQLESITSKYDFETIDAQLEAAEKAKIEAMSAEERNELRIQTLSSDFDSQKATLAGEFDDFKSKANSEAEMLRSALYTNLKGNEIQKTINDFDGIPKLLEPHISKDVQVVQGEDGNFATRIVKGGEVQYDAASGKPLTVAQLVESYKEDEDYGVCFKASKASGSSANGSDNKSTKSAVSALNRSSMSIGEKSAYIAEHGQAGYEELAI